MSYLEFVLCRAGTGYTPPPPRSAPARARGNPWKPGVSLGLGTGRDIDVNDQTLLLSTVITVACVIMSTPLPSPNRLPAMRAPSSVSAGWRLSHVIQSGRHARYYFPPGVTRGAGRMVRRDFFDSVKQVRTGPSLHATHTPHA